jgi:hypothetical protein
MKGMVRKDFLVCSAQLGRLEACPGAGVYSSAGREKITWPQWYGIFVHRFLERCQTRGYEAALEYIRSKHMKRAITTCERIDPDGLLYGAAEVGFLHDVFDDTSRQIEWDLLSHADKSREQYGRADLIVVNGVPRPLIGDYKCGGADEDPAESTQLLGLAAAWRAKTGDQEIDLAFMGVMSTGEIEWTVQTVDKSDLDCYVDRSRTVHERILGTRRRAEEGSEPAFVRGDHCEWCRLQEHCPAWAVAPVLSGVAS